MFLVKDPYLLIFEKDKVEPVKPEKSTIELVNTFKKCSIELVTSKSLPWPLTVFLYLYRPLTLFLSFILQQDSELHIYIQATLYMPLVLFGS